MACSHVGRVHLAKMSYCFGLITARPLLLLCKEFLLIKKKFDLHFYNCHLVYICDSERTRKIKHISSFHWNTKEDFLHIELWYKKLTSTVVVLKLVYFSVFHSWSNKNGFYKLASFLDCHKKSCVIFQSYFSFSLMLCSQTICILLHLYLC